MISHKHKFIFIHIPKTAGTSIEKALRDETCQLLTFYPGYQFKTDGEQFLWVRGPINAPKDGLHPLEYLVDTSMLPCTIAVHWKFTRSHQTIRFAASEPFATLLLYPKSGLENVSVEVIQLDDGEDAYEQAFQQMIDDPAVHSLFRRLGATSSSTKFASTAVEIEDDRQLTVGPTSA